MKRLRIAVCIKQVPEGTAKGVLPDGHIRRNDRSAILNPADLFALETALMLKDSGNAEIDVFTMGTETAGSILKEAAALGADRLFLLSDADFAGADTYATACVLAAALRKTAAYDLIFCGRRTLDGETGQVPVQIAELLGIPVVTNVVHFALEQERAVCRRLLEDCGETVEGALPAVISVMEGMEGILHPRLPSLAGMRRAAQTTPCLLDRQGLGLEKAVTGRKGSFTEVDRVFSPDWGRKCAFCSMEEGLEKTNALLLRLKAGTGMEE